MKTTPHPLTRGIACLLVLCLLGTSLPATGEVFSHSTQNRSAAQPFNFQQEALTVAVLFAHRPLLHALAGLKPILDFALLHKDLALTALSLPVVGMMASRSKRSYKDKLPYPVLGILDLTQNTDHGGLIRLHFKDIPIDDPTADFETYSVLRLLEPPANFVADPFSLTAFILSDPINVLVLLTTHPKPAAIGLSSSDNSCP